MYNTQLHVTTFDRKCIYGKNRWKIARFLAADGCEVKALFLAIKITTGIWTQVTLNKSIHAYNLVDIWDEST